MGLRGGKGKYNSSATRIRPFFEALEKMDPTGRKWLPKLLAFFSDQSALSDDLIADPGEIVKMIFETEGRGEQAIGPPEAFLRWLLENPERMSWPSGQAGKFGPETLKWRSALMGRSEGAAGISREIAIREGLLCLAKNRAHRSARKWWAFEGSTKVDCYIETHKLCLYIEGKRTEPLSSSTAWFPQRNQFVRNLEAAREHANGRAFACLLLSELPVSVTQFQVDAGLPHMFATSRSELLRQYLGNMTWKQACEITGVCFEELPDTVG